MDLASSSAGSLQIRLLTVDDPAALVALFEEVLPGFKESMQDDGPSAFLYNPASFALGAYLDNGEPAGLGWGLQMRAPSGRLTTYLHELDVRVEWRRRGIGAAQALYASLGGDRKPPGDVNYWWTLD